MRLSSRTLRAKTVPMKAAGAKGLACAPALPEAPAGSCTQKWGWLNPVGGPTPPGSVAPTKEYAAGSCGRCCVLYYNNRNSTPKEVAHALVCCH